MLDSIRDAANNILVEGEPGNPGEGLHHTQSARWQKTAKGSSGRRRPRGSLGRGCPSPLEV